MPCFLSSFQPPEGAALTPEEIANAHRAAAESIRRRHERDSAALLDSLAAQKASQRSRLQAQLAAIATQKKGNLKSLNNDAKDTESYATEADILAELREVDWLYKEQEAAALRQTQQQVMLQLAGIFVSKSVLEGGEGDGGVGGAEALGGASLYESGEGGGAEGYYLQSPREPGAGGGGGGALSRRGGEVGRGVRDWLQGVEGLRGAFLESAADLQAKLSLAFAEAETVSGRAVAGAGTVAEGDEGGEDDCEFQHSRRALAVYMNKVIVLCAVCCVECAPSLLPSPPSQGRGRLVQCSGEPTEHLFVICYSRCFCWWSWWRQRNYRSILC